MRQLPKMADQAEKNASSKFSRRNVRHGRCVFKLKLPTASSCDARITKIITHYVIPESGHKNLFHISSTCMNYREQR